MTPEKNLQEAVALVLSFVSEMNDWETRRYYRSRVDCGYEFTAKRDLRLAGHLSAEELDAEYLRLFEDHCTKRKRVYGGFPSCFSKPPKYAGVTSETVIDVVLVKPGRIEVICSGEQPETKFKFVLFRKGGKWKIDNLLTSYKDRQWERRIL